MKKNPFYFSLAFLVLVLAFPFSALAQGNIHLGKLEVHPGLNLGYTYTDNVLQQPSDLKEKENIIEITPSLDLRFPTSHHMFRLGYNLAVYDFTGMGEIKLKNSVMGSLEFNFPVGLILRLSDNFAQRVYPSASMQEQVGITEHWENNAYAEIGYILTQRWSVSGRYKNQMLRYQDLSASDHDINSGGAALYLRLMTRLSLFSEIWYGKVGYKESASTDQDATYFQGFLGLGGRVSPKTNFTIKAGFENRAYSDSDSYPTTNAPVVSLSLEERPSTHLSFSINASRSVAESVYENNSHYISTGGEANLTVNLLRMLALGADVSYFLLQYEKENNGGDKRTDNILQIRPSVKVDITRWLRATAGYTMRNRSSNVEEYKFKENRIEASLNAVL